MFFSTALTLLALVVSQVLALNNTNSTNPSRYVRAPIYRQGPANDPGSGYYWIDLGFGHYTAQCIVDSGSGDLWVADKPGGYQAINSPTYHQINSSWDVEYDSKVGASGNWGTEDITLPGGLVAQDVLFGDATSPGAGSGFMGVSLKAGGAPPSLPLNPPQMLIGLVENNITNSMTFSLYLSPKSLSSPSTAASQIIFGGIDPSLYLGTLYEFASYSTSDNAPYGDQYYYVQLSDISATSTGASLFNGDAPYPILVDSGTVQMLLPQDQADAIAALANATYHNSTSLGDNYFVANCSNVPFNDSLTFTLSGQLKIVVPWTDIVNQNTGTPGQCIIPIGYAQHAGGGILGAEFLRHTYLVFDADNARLAMAQAAPDPGTGPVSPSRRKRALDGIIPIPAGTGIMPGATFIQALPVPPKPVSSTPASSSASANGSPASSGMSIPASSISPTGSVNPYLASSGSSSAPVSSGLPSSDPFPRTTSATASINPYPRPQSSAGVIPSLRPYPPSPSAASNGISININFNQTIYIDSPEFGMDGYGWWMCSQSDTPSPGQMEMSPVAGEEYDVGSCIVNVAVMEYVHILGEVTSTETVCLTTTTVVAECVCPTA